MYIIYIKKKLPDVGLCLLLNEPPNIHLLGLSETRIDSHITDDMLAIPNYNIIRRDAVHFGQTGLAVYIHDDLSQFVIRRSDLESSQVECIWFEVKYSMSPPLLLGYVYRNPASTQLWLDDFVHMMDKVNASNNSILLLGDFNFDMFKPQRTWVSTTSLFGLHQLVQCATRVTPISSTLLDHIYTNNKPLIADVKVQNKSISDHSPITCK
jgi:exonuclease III